MKKNGIDDLLRIVKPELIAGYEANQLDGQKLSVVNEEYKAAVFAYRGLDLYDWIILTGFSMLVGVILSIYLQMFAGVPKYIAITVMLAIIAPACLCLIFPVKWKFDKDRETCYQCEPIMRDFKQAVEVLGGYDEHSIRENLILLAGNLLDAENRFKKLRMIENSSTDQILFWGNHEVEGRKLFEEALVVARKFNLAFSKPDLFVLGKKYLDLPRGGGFRFG